MGEVIELKNLKTISQLVYLTTTDQAERQNIEQFLHDIRSPLQVLHGMIGDSIEQNSVEKLAYQRLMSILKRFEVTHLEASAKNTLDGHPCEQIVSTIDQVIREKQKLYPEIQFSTHHQLPGPRKKNPHLKLEINEFAVMICNLLNNAIESFTKKSQHKIHLHSWWDKRKFTLEISDNGRGIPHSVMLQLEKGGLSFGKRGGSGLGLEHARQKIHHWGGKLAIKSRYGHGHRVSIELDICDSE